MELRTFAASARSKTLRDCQIRKIILYSNVFYQNCNQKQLYLREVIRSIDGCDWHNQFIPKNRLLLPAIVPSVPC